MSLKGKEKKRLRSGYTTGACAAAAAKAALLLLRTGKVPEKVEIPFPDTSRHNFCLCRSQLENDFALASIVKDAGDDPDVTNGAEIGVELRWHKGEQGRSGQLRFTPGEGVGLVTKPGLALAVGEAAINPVPRQMIAAALDEVMPAAVRPMLEVRVFVKNGLVLAQKTLNERLGIIGGLSILGTTGIVRPVSAKAWTDTIEASMAVARAAGLNEVVLSTGRTSETVVQRHLQVPEESLVMMGDYLHYALTAAKKHGFARVHLAEMWAKMIKAALGVEQTHVRHGALDVQDAARLLQELGLEADLAQDFFSANTAREIYERLVQEKREDLISAVAHRAQVQAESWSGLPVEVYLITAEKKMVLHVSH